MPYSRKTWADGAAGGTPITAAELNRMEAGVKYAMAMHNVLDYGAVGSNDGSNVATVDDTAGIQAAIDAANLHIVETVKGDSNGTGIVFFPGNRDYKITSTLSVPPGIHLLGGSGTGHGTANPPRIRWYGPAGGTMAEVVVADNVLNIPGVFVEQMNFDGRNHTSSGAGIGNGAGYGFVFRRATDQTAGKLDTGTQFVDAWFVGFTQDAINVQVPGMTNFVFTRGRFDQISGYAINTRTTGGCYMVISDMTYDNMLEGTNPPRSKGFLFLDGEGTGTGKSYVTLRSLHLEVNGSLEPTYQPTGWTPKGTDQRGVIRLGVNTTSANVTQHNISFENMWVPHPASTNPYSIFQVTSADLAADNRGRHAVAVRITGTNLEGVTGSTGDPNANNSVAVIGGVPLEHAFPLGVEHGVASAGVAFMDYHPHDNPGMLINVPGGERKVSWTRGDEITGNRRRIVLNARSIGGSTVTSGSTTVTTTANSLFNAADIGAEVAGTGITAGTTIASVTDPKTIVLSAAATASGSNLTLTITPKTRRVQPREHGHIFENELTTDVTLLLPVLWEGFEIEAYRQSSGVVIFTADGTTIRPGNNRRLAAQFDSARARYRARNEIVLTGDDVV